MSNPRIAPFDDFTARYDRWFETHSRVYGSELLALRELVPPSSRGVEIGVGSGRFAVPLSVKFGIEPSVKMVRIARERGIGVIRGLAEALPLADSITDLALMITTVCFVSDLGASFEEVRRVLIPRGTFVVGFIDRESVLGQRYEESKAENPFYRAATFRGADEILELLEGSGFGNFQIRQTIFEDISEIDSLEEPRKGYGEGSFVAMRAEAIPGKL